jgi:type II secretory pathway component GspD/PulD (secretin)
MLAILRPACCLLTLVSIVPLGADTPSSQNSQRARARDEARTQAASPPPAPAAEAPAAPTEASEPLYTLDVHHQDTETVLWEFAKRAKKNLNLLDRPASLVTVYFANLPFEKGLKEILQAADLDYVKSEDGYTIGLPIDLKLRFPNPENQDKDIEATYRCRRIDAATLVEAVKAVFPQDGFRVFAGPQFLTPEVQGEGASGVGEDSGIHVLKASDKVNRTHDVVFSGRPELVLRALALARKFDRPRKQVRVNIRVVQMTTSASRNLGVAWMQSLSFTANEQGNIPSTESNTSTTAPQGTGITLGKFSHSVVSLNATLNAMEQAGDSKTVANPTLLVLDGEKSFILSGTKYVLPKIDSRDATGQAVYSTVTIKVGLYLQVGVQVGLDDDMVLNIYPQVTNLTGFTTVDRVDYPIINTIEEEATVRAVKGDVIVLGGIKRDVTTDSKAAVPGLASLPVLGKLFSNDSKTKNTEELMFFLTPEIVEDAEQPLEMKLSVSPGAVPPAP